MKKNIKKKKIFWLDLPNPFDKDKDSWINVGKYTTRQEAIKTLNSWFGGEIEDIFDNVYDIFITEGEE